MLASVAGDTAQYWVTIIGKILLLLAGLAVLLDLIGPDRLSRLERKAKRRQDRTRRHRTLILGARKLEGLTRRMAREAARETGVLSAGLGHLTADQFRAWTRDAQAELSTGGQDPRRLGPDFATPAFEPLARRYFFWDDRVCRAERLGLRIIHRYFEIHGRRSWKVGVALFGLAPPAAAVVTCLGGERNPVLIGCAIFSAGWLALVIWAALRFPAVMLGLMRAEATVRFQLAHGARALLGKNGNRMRWAALMAFLVGSLLDLAAAL